MKNVMSWKGQWSIFVSSHENSLTTILPVCRSESEPAGLPTDCSLDILTATVRESCFKSVTFFHVLSLFFGTELQLCLLDL
jgi:hypothetical protein